MAAPSVTYTFSNGTTADATQVNQNFTDVINGLSDGTKDLTVSALTASGTISFTGSTISLGNAVSDALNIIAATTLSDTNFTQTLTTADRKHTITQSGGSTTATNAPLVVQLTNTGSSLSPAGYFESRSDSGNGVLHAYSKATRSGTSAAIYAAGDGTGGSILLAQNSKDSTPIDILNLLGTGAITVGTTAATNNNHTFRSGAQTILAVDAAVTSDSVLRFSKAGTAKHSIYVPTSSNSLSFYSHGSANAEVGSCTEGGAWTFGRAVNVVAATVTNESTSTGGYALVVQNTSTNVGSRDVAVMKIQKGYADVANNQWYLEFLDNAGGTNHGYIGNASATTVSLHASSDRRIKKNIKTLTGALEKICAIRPVEFELKSNGEKDVRYVAQELAEVFPNLVTKSDDGLGDDVPEGVRPWAVTDGPLIPYLITAIKELKAEFDAYKASHP
jgi:hypothetical protein